MWSDLEECIEVLGTRKVVKIWHAGRKDGSFRSTSVEEINVIGFTDPPSSRHEHQLSGLYAFSRMRFQ